MAVDYTELNKVLKKDEYPMPVIEVFLNTLKGIAISQQSTSRAGSIS